MHSFQVSEPGSLTISAPLWLPACHMPNTAPVGSAATAMRPALITSIGGMNTRPPASVTFAATASTSSTARYVVHTGGSCEPGWFAPRPATGRPESSAIV
jgi:hypothetical protein